MKRVLVAGGGTGGHLFPGISVVQELRRRYPDVEALFVGTSRGLEQRVLPDLGERFEPFEVKPIQGGGWLGMVRSMVSLPLAVGRALSLVRRFDPDLVLGLGGYTAGPVVLAASLMGRRTALLEQNARVGMTNRLLSRWVGRAYVTFSSTANEFRRDRVRVTGNPVRREIAQVAGALRADPDGQQGGEPTLVVLGGSQGSRRLNQVVPMAVGQLGLDALRVIHQSGESMRQEVQRAYGDLGVRAEVCAFVDDMASLYRGATVIVARAGATTVAEICAVGRAGVFVPYPFAADDHQRVNAEALCRRGAGVTLLEADLTPETLGRELRVLFGDAARRADMAQAARVLGVPDAAALVVDDLMAWWEDLPTTQSGGGHGSGDVSDLVAAGHAADSGGDLRVTRHGLLRTVHRRSLVRGWEGRPEGPVDRGAIFGQ